MTTHQKIRTKDYFYIAIGSALGLGLSPILPGTCGALLGVFFHVMIALFLPGTLQPPALIVIFLLVCFANHLLTPWAEDFWKCEDPGCFVLDEVAGYLFVPILFRYGTLWEVVLWGFLLFRVLDIFKMIPPTKYIDQNVPGSWGILLDDLMSATYAALIMYLIYWIRPGWLTGDLS